MAFPTTAPVLTQDESVIAITEAEAGILQCLQDFFCALLGDIQVDTELTLEEKTELSKKLICAAAAKEKSIGLVLQGLAAKILADKGLVPNGDADDCDC